MHTKELAKAIFLDALEASMPKNFIPHSCTLDGEIFRVQSESYDLSSYNNIYLFGSGKAAFTMAKEIEKIFGSRIHKGVVVAPKTSQKLNFTELCEGSHPLPTQKSIESTQKLVSVMQEMQGNDFYIYLLSGGSSALIELPLAPITLEEMQKTTELMLHSGLDIVAMNTVRKHISQIKGGRLASMCKADGVVLTLSDIMGDDLYSIGSAPLYADKSSYLEAQSLLQERGIFSQMPLSVQEVLQKGVLQEIQEIQETPKEPKKSVRHHILASNTLALKSALKSAQGRGLSVEVSDEPMQGSVHEMVLKMLNVAEKSQSQVVLFGGECTVEVEGNGRGGRNQHAVALALEKICEQKKEMTFLSAGTDGIDGNSDAAGAVVSSKECGEVSLFELSSAIKRFDTHSYFKKSNSLLITGASGTNVIDIAVIIKGE
ncbi:MAG: DUF4147 domain-containing protein [Campylobacterales bacterium]|nr:DUF4147 domain-containing protein [Campylobacterales bacterium]